MHLTRYVPAAMQTRLQAFSRHRSFKREHGSPMPPHTPASAMYHAGCWLQSYRANIVGSRASLVKSAAKSPEKSPVYLVRSMHNVTTFENRNYAVRTFSFEMIPKFRIETIADH